MDWAYRTLDWIEENMRTPICEGFENTFPIESGFRHQNPHMHLLEAFLALYETSGEPRFAEGAHAVLDLFRRRMFDPETGTIAEFYNLDWLRLPTAQGRRLEPGHHFEWVWLLAEANDLLGENTAPEMSALYQFALEHGTHSEIGWVIDAVDVTGVPLEKCGRVWPQTEAIKAHSRMWRRGGEQANLEAARLINMLLTHHLARLPSGTWNEHLTPDGRPVSDKIPTTTLYHIVAALREIKRAVGRPNALAGLPQTARPGQEDAPSNIEVRGGAV